MVRHYSDHVQLVNAGWAYRMNMRGLVIYRNPTTNLWHPRQEALEIAAWIGSAPKPGAES